MDTIELIECERYHCGLTRAACEKYQAADAGNCRKCKVTTGGEAKTVTVDASTIQQPERTMAKEAKCSGCGRTMKILGRGLCGTCYMRVRKQEKIAAKSSASAKPREGAEDPPAVPSLRLEKDKDAYTLQLKFYGEDASVLLALTQLATRERRTVEGQVMHLIDKAVEACRESI